MPPVPANDPRVQLTLWECLQFNDAGIPGFRVTLYHRNCEPTTDLARADFITINLPDENARAITFPAEFADVAGNVLDGIRMAFAAGAEKEGDRIARSIGVRA